LDLEIRDRAEVVRAINRYVLSGRDDLTPLLEVDRAEVRVDVAAADDVWTVALTHLGGPVAIGLRLEDARPITDPGWAVVDDGWFELFPGESRTVTVRWTGERPTGRCLRLSGWNVPDAWLTA
jgi:hypothetical protein